MAQHDLIVIGASAGGLEVLKQIAQELPPGLPAAICVVSHLPAGAQSALPEILSRKGPLLARHASDGEPVYPGQIYVAPPDHHLLIGAGQLRLSRGPRENNLRPAIDPLFRSAARHYGPRVVAVLLSGGHYDGVAGLLAVRTAGGVAVVQDPADALFPDLPRKACQVAGADHVVPVTGLASRLRELVQQPATEERGSRMEDFLDRMATATAADQQAQAQNQRQGNVSVFVCPECGGCLWQMEDSQLVHFRCHVGHTYDGHLLLNEQSEALEAALWTAIRTFREKGILARQLAQAERLANRLQSAERFEEQAQQAEHYSRLVQQLLDRGAQPLASAPSATPATRGV